MSNESKYISAASFCKWHHYLMNFSKKVITFFIKDFDIWFICTYFFFKWSIVIYFILKALLSCKNLYPILLYALYNNSFSNRHFHPFTQGQLVLSKVLLILSSWEHTKMSLSRKWTPRYYTKVMYMYSCTCVVHLKIHLFDLWNVPLTVECTLTLTHNLT